MKKLLTIRFGSRHATGGSKSKSKLNSDTADRLERIRQAKPSRTEEQRATRRAQKQRLAARRRAGVVGMKEPELTEPIAKVFVKAIYAGLSPLAALRYFAPAYFDFLTPASRDQWLHRWASSLLVADATRAHNGGEWHELTPDERVRVSMDKHIAELAHYLHSHRYADAVDDEQRKMVDARQALREHLKGLDAEKDKGVWASMVRDILAGKTQGMSIPQMPRHGEEQGQAQIGPAPRAAKSKMKVTLALKHGPAKLTVEKKR